MTDVIQSGAHGAPEPFDSFTNSRDSESARSADSWDDDARRGRGAAPDDDTPSGDDDPGSSAHAAAPVDDLDASGHDGAEVDAESTAAADGATPARKRRRRGSRGGRRRSRREAGPEAAAALADEEPAAGTALAATIDPPIPGEDGEEDLALAEDALDTTRAPTEGTAEGRRRRRSRRGRGRRTGASAAAGLASEPAAEPSARPSAAPRGSVPREIDALDDDADLALDAVPADGGEPEEPTGPEAEPSDVALAELDGSKRRRRGNRGGRRRKKRGGEDAARVAAPKRGRAPAAVEIESIPGEEDDLPESSRVPAVEVEAAEEPRGSRRRRRGRGREVRAADEDADAPRVVPESARRAVILVNATDPEEQRVAVLEDSKITDFLMTVKDQDTLVNDIYRGRVVNLEPAIGAAFVDFGQGRNGFLHTSDVLSAYGDDDFDLDKLLSTQIDPEEWDSNSSQPEVSAELDEADDEDGAPAKKGRKAQGGRGKRRFQARPRLPITDLLEKGQTVVVQVTKDAIGDKGPTLTTYISIPGRYLVLMPSMSRTGVSRKIEDEKERRRLKRILQSLEVPKGMGVIVRTAGIGHSKTEIQRDLDYLVSLWTAFGKKLHQGHGPAPLYRESDVAIRTMRDLFTTNTKSVIVDDPEVQRQIVEFTEKLMPEDVGRIQLHDQPKPLFQAYNVEPDFERIFQRRIELPSGGSIVFDQAEALVAIDVNSGRTRSEGFDFEDIALKTNLEAAPEIARQMRLRDLGGIIVVDFIDMLKAGNVRAVEKAFKEALSSDRARSKVGRISQFGLLEMTRQRLGPGMDKKVFQHCPRCRGTGRIRTVNSRAAAILRRLSSALTHKGFQTVELRAHPEVVAYLKSDCSDHLRALEYRFQKDVRLLDAPDQPEDSVLRYLREDGREVRPGGRRKR